MEIGELLNKREELDKDLRLLIDKRITQFCTECGVCVRGLLVNLRYYYPGITAVYRDPTNATCESTVNITLDI